MSFAKLMAIVLVRASVDRGQRREREDAEARRRVRGLTADDNGPGRRHARAEHAQVCCSQSSFMFHCCRYTLNFGKVSYYLGYNAMEDFFPTWPMRPNPVCTNKQCVKLQTKYAVTFASLFVLFADAVVFAGLDRARVEQASSVDLPRARGERVGNHGDGQQRRRHAGSSAGRSQGRALRIRSRGQLSVPLF